MLWDVGLVGAADDVEVTPAAGSRAGAVPGVRGTRRRLPAGEATVRRGVAVTTPLRTALDLGRIQPPDDAVIALDRFLGTGLVFLDGIRAAALHATGRDCRRIRAAVDLADGLAESPQETRLRLLIHRAGLPRPVARYRIRVDGRFVARPDFAWPEERLAVEYDGAWHGEPGRFRRDRQRLNRLTAAGWRVLFVTAADLRDPARLIARIAQALASSPSYV